MPTPDDDLDIQDDPAEQPKKNFRRELEERLTAAEQRAATAEKRALIAEAGLSNLTDRQRSILTSQIDGDATADKVREIASELGWANQPVQQEQPSGVPAEELAALDRVTGSLTDPLAPPRPDPVSEMERALAEGGLDGLMEAAAKQGLPTSWSQQ